MAGHELDMLIFDWEDTFYPVSHSDWEETPTFMRKWSLIYGWSLNPHHALHPVSISYTNILRHRRIVFVALHRMAASLRYLCTKSMNGNRYFSTYHKWARQTLRLHADSWTASRARLDWRRSHSRWTGTSPHADGQCWRDVGSASSPSGTGLETERWVQVGGGGIGKWEE